MKLPSAEEYVQIIDRKNPGDLATLYNHRFILEDGKTYLNKRSRNHIIFKTEHHSKFFAARFFLNDDDELFRRYHQIQDYLNHKSLSWKVPFRFMDEEYYPVILMDWMDSFSLTEYLDLIINNPSLIGKLQQELIDLSQSMERNGIGHGNLNMTHIRFTKQDHVLKLIDYDSMFIPAFREKDSFSAGTSGFQHPVRLASDFSETIDRFSFWVLLTALEAFKTDPSLWENSKEYGFNKEQQILFTYRDIAFAKQSATFQMLRRYNSAPLNFYCDQLIAFCSAASLNDIETPKLYQERNTVSLNKNQNPVYEVAPTNKKVTTSENQLTTVVTTPENPIAVSKKTIPDKEKKPDNIQAEHKLEKEEKQELYVSPKRKRKTTLAIFIVIAILLASTIAYVAWNSRSKETNTVVAAVSEPISKSQTIVQRKEEQKPEETVFTSRNIVQFLFQLYQSYNKRDLASILSNYADSLTQYYDAGAVSKNKLSDIIKNLFIKPAYYECHPDLTTLQFNAQRETCTLTIAINETIKANKRSRKENYSSKVEYTVDKSFKILAEKNIE